MSTISETLNDVMIPRATMAKLLFRNEYGHCAIHEAVKSSVRLVKIASSSTQHLKRRRDCALGPGFRVDANLRFDHICTSWARNNTQF